MQYEVSNDELKRLKQLVNFFNPLSEELSGEFSSIFSPYSCKRKTLLTAAGDTERYLYFVVSGVQRAFYLKNDDKEATLVFTYTGSFSGVADSFLLQQPSRYYLEALTESSFLRTSYTQLNLLMNRHHEIERCIRIALGYTLAGALERQIELQCFSAEEKFRTLLKRSPHVMQMIPHKYLASYLGIDATTFSKLLGSIKI